MGAYLPVYLVSCKILKACLPKLACTRTHACMCVRKENNCTLKKLLILQEYLLDRCGMAVMVDIVQADSAAARADIRKVMDCMVTVQGIFY